MCDECPLHEIVPLPENRDAWQLYNHCSTQWVFPGMGGPAIGLNMPGVESVARLAGIAITPELFEQLRLMEQETISIMRARFEEANETPTRDGSHGARLH